MFKTRTRADRKKLGGRYTAAMGKLIDLHHTRRLVQLVFTWSPIGGVSSLDILNPVTGRDGYHKGCSVDPTKEPTYHKKRCRQVLHLDL